MGFGASETRTVVVFESNVVNAGSNFQLTVKCDNSKCSSRVKSFKIKLQRKWVGFFETGSKKGSEYLTVVKTEGVSSFSTKTINTMLKLPLHEANGDYLASSCVGKILSI